MITSQCPLVQDHCTQLQDATSISAFVHLPYDVLQCILPYLVVPDIIELSNCNTTLRRSIATYFFLHHSHISRLCFSRWRCTSMQTEGVPSACVAVRGGVMIRYQSGGQLHALYVNQTYDPPNEIVDRGVIELAVERVQPVTVPTRSGRPHTDRSEPSESTRSGQLAHCNDYSSPKRMRKFGDRDHSYATSSYWIFDPELRFVGGSDLGRTSTYTLSYCAPTRSFLLYMVAPAGRMLGISIPLQCEHFRFVTELDDDATPSFTTPNYRFDMRRFRWYIDDTTLAIAFCRVARCPVDGRLFPTVCILLRSLREPLAPHTDAGSDVEMQYVESLNAVRVAIPLTFLQSDCSDESNIVPAFVRASKSTGVVHVGVFESTFDTSHRCSDMLHIIEYTPATSASGEEVTAYHIKTPIPAVKSPIQQYADGTLLFDTVSTDTVRYESLYESLNIATFNVWLFSLSDMRIVRTISVPVPFVATNTTDTACKDSDCGITLEAFDSADCTFVFSSVNREQWHTVQPIVQLPQQRHCNPYAFLHA